jgi:uncharacterized protein (TIGR02611 family)
MSARKKLKHTWWKVPVTIRKPLVFILGTIVVIAGIAMLALPGPGWVTIFLGFAILASEFTFAEKVRDKLVYILKRIIAYAEMRWHSIRTYFKHK